MDSELRRLERAGPSPDLLNAYKRAGRREEYLELRAHLGYWAEVAALPLPTAEQSEAFLQWFVEAHSWYKAGNNKWSCVFFLDPSVMMDTPAIYPARCSIEDYKGKYFTKRHQVKEIEVKRPSNWIPTKQWREKYGYWNYCNWTSGGILESTTSIFTEGGFKLSMAWDDLGGLTFLTGKVHGHLLEEDEMPPIGKLIRKPDGTDFDYGLATRKNNEARRMEHNLIRTAMAKHLEEVKTQTEKYL